MKACEIRKEYCGYVPAEYSLEDDEMYLHVIMTAEQLEWGIMMEAKIGDIRDMMKDSNEEK
jgi:hypothetical protein